MKPALVCWWVEFDKQGRAVRRLYHRANPEPPSGLIPEAPSPPKVTRGVRVATPEQQGTLI